jgi:hypothetical protein
MSKRKCVCASIGADGTTRHSRIIGMVIRPRDLETSELKSPTCSNHRFSYESAGWRFEPTPRRLR